MSSEGPKSPGTSTSDGFGLGLPIAWTDPNNSQSSNDTNASVSLITFSPSEYLTATNFTFSIVVGSTILGVLVEIEKSSPGSVVDSSVRLIKGGVLAGDEKAIGSNWPNSDQYISYGGASDLWGTTLTASDVNSSNFGVGISAAANGASPVANVDHIRMTVYFTSPIIDLGVITGMVL